MSRLRNRRPMVYERAEGALARSRIPSRDVARLHDLKYSGPSASCACCAKQDAGCSPSLEGNHGTRWTACSVQHGLSRRTPKAEATEIDLFESSAREEPGILALGPIKSAADASDIHETCIHVFATGRAFHRRTSKRRTGSDVRARHGLASAGNSANSVVFECHPTA